MLVLMDVVALYSYTEREIETVIQFGKQFFR